MGNSTMSEKQDNPPSYDASTNKNEDTRPLPDGWVKQFDNNYKQHFYVDTRANPPRSTWIHPIDEQGSSYLIRNTNPIRNTSPIRSKCTHSNPHKCISTS